MVIFFFLHRLSTFVNTTAPWKRQRLRVARQHSRQQGCSGASGGGAAQHRALSPRRQAGAEGSQGTEVPGTDPGPLRPAEGDPGGKSGQLR